MRTRSIAGLLILGSLGFAGCSAEPPGPAPSPTASASAAAVPTPSSATAVPTPTSVAPATALSIAEELQRAIPAITSVTEVTAANDSTGSIGQPGKYTSAAWIADTGAAAPEKSVVGGAVVEVFASEAEAQARLSALQQHIALGPAFNAEHHYLQGTVLLRVSGALGPEQAALYEQAFTGASLESTRLK